MPDAYAQLLDSLGFNAADAAQQTGQVQRNLEFEKARIAQTGEDQRRGLKADAEARGVLSSGEYHRRGARQRADEAGAYSQAEVGAADHIQGINRELQRAKAQAELAAKERAMGLEAQAQSQRLAEQAAQRDYQRYITELSYSQTPGGGGGGLSWDGVESYLYGGGAGSVPEQSPSWLTGGLSWTKRLFG